jgi:hypothetical protein
MRAGPNSLMSRLISHLASASVMRCSAVSSALNSSASSSILLSTRANIAFRRANGTASHAENAFRAALIAIANSARSASGTVASRLLVTACISHYSGPYQGLVPLLLLDQLSPEVRGNFLSPMVTSSSPSRRCIDSSSLPCKCRPPSPPWRHQALDERKLTPSILAREKDLHPHPEKHVRLRASGAQR